MDDPVPSSGVFVCGRSAVAIPYTGPDDESLPSNVKKFDAKKRRQWVHVFNTTFTRCKKKGGSGCEKAAFRVANGVAKNATYAGLLGGEHPLGRAFIELAAAEPPETINVFPSPGTYKHPLWGDVEVTEEGNQQFVENFNAHIYQEHVPIDAEHETKVSGAVGYLKELSMNDDGSIEAVVDWTERGRKLIGDDSFKYISPEWYETWTDPASGDAYENVLIGAALTTRPFFKDLRSLVASEGRLYDLEDSDSTRVPVVRSSVEGISYGDLQAMVLSAARHEFPGTFGSSEYAGWVTDLYDEYAIIEASGRYWRLDYAYDGNEIVFPGQPEEVRRVTGWETVSHQAKDYSPEERRKLATKGQAMSDGSYPIVTEADLSNAIQAFGRAKNKEAVKRHIKKRAKALGKSDMLPEDWSGSTKKTKEDYMTKPDVEDVVGQVGELEEEDQRSLFQRLAASLKATVKFGHDDLDNNQEDEDGDGDGDRSTESSDSDDTVAKTAAEVTALKGTLDAERTAREAAEKRLAGLEASERDRRYRDIILGRDEESVKRAASEDAAVLRPMVGDLAAKMQIMQTLAATKGEDSDEFKAYVAGEREHANQLHEAGMFSEIGRDSDGGPVESTAIREFDQRVAALTRGEKALSSEEAIAKVAAEDPKLYDRYDREKTGRKASYPSS